MPIYSAYGLTFDSELPFPELLPSSKTTSTVSLGLGNVPFSQSDPSLARVLYKPLSLSEIIVHYNGVGTAQVRAGSTITLHLHPNADSLAVRLFVLQQVLGVVLLQRGYFVLHASAAAINGRAVVFAGPSGQGKSTMLAALNRVGFPIITDDVLAIDTADPHRPLALPGLVQLKLNDETRAKVARGILTEQPIGDRSSKKLCDLRGVRVTEPIPLSAIFLLETGPTLKTIAVPKARAAIELVRHTYGSRLLQATDLSARHFEQSVALARQIPVAILSRPRELSLLPEIVTLLTRPLPS